MLPKGWGLGGLAAVTTLAAACTMVLHVLPVAGGTGVPGGGHVLIAKPSRAGAATAAGGSVRSVVGLGDSVPAGSGCDCATYVSLIGQTLATTQGTDVVSDNLAVGGLTSQGLLDQLDSGPARDAVVNADLAVVTIGANDFGSDSIEDESCGPSAGLACYREDLARLRANVDAVLARVRALQARPGSRIVVTGYWNVFLDGASARAMGPAYVANSDALTLAVNETLAAAAAARGALYADVYTAFKGDGSRDDTALLAADGDHPGATGHQVIARSVLSALAGK